MKRGKRLKVKGERLLLFKSILILESWLLALNSSNV